MKLTVEKAIEILENAKKYIKDDRWIRHSICVGNAAAVIAKELELDANYTKALGYVHDIGKYINPDDFEWHDVNGYSYLISLGIDEEDAIICLTHSYINGDINCTAGGFPAEHELRCEYLKNHDYTYYEKIINLCDLMCTTEVMPLEKRLIDLLLRKGIHDNTKYHITEAKKLKEEFDILVGCDINLLFSEITGVKEAFLCYDYDECGIHLKVDEIVCSSRKLAKERVQELNNENGGDWSIYVLPVKYKSD